MIASAMSTSPLTATAPQRKSVWPESFLRGSGEFVGETGGAGRRDFFIPVYSTILPRFMELQKIVGYTRIRCT